MAAAAFRVGCCVAAAALLQCAAAEAPDDDGPPSPPPGWRLTWHDEFDGDSIDTTKWTVYDNRTHGPKELQLYVKEAVTVSNGALQLMTKKENRSYTPDKTYHYTSGWVETQGKFSQKFGRFEARMLLPDANVTAVWPAFWLMPEDGVCWPTGGEIDILEQAAGSFNNTIMGTFHWATECGKDLYRGHNGHYPPMNSSEHINFHASFHRFAVEWNETTLAWFIDDIIYHVRSTMAPVRPVPVPTTAFYIILNQAMAFWKPSPTPESDAYLPTPLVIDWVRVYEPDTAPNASLAPVDTSGSSSDDDQALVTAHVAAQANTTFRNASGQLRYPFLVPAGPYNQLWDWDSLALGVALRGFGAQEYFAGSMLNFLDHTNTTTGEVQGCLLPSGPTGTISHAKPIVIQGAWLSVKQAMDGFGGNATALLQQFMTYRPQMEALLTYWGSGQRVDASTGLRRWHDQLQSGADNLVTSLCPSKYSTDCWVEEDDAYTLASSDVHVFLIREHNAYAKFLDAWADMADDAAEEESLRHNAAVHRQLADSLLTIMNKWLWNATAGVYQAYNTSTTASARGPISNRVFLMALPLWGGLATPEQAAAVSKQVAAPDMQSKWGVRSTASSDPRYSNANEIVPYSNWRGPVWVVANAFLAYGMTSSSYTGVSGLNDAGIAIARAIVATLAADLRTTGTWHECYSSDTGKGLAAPGFLSWDTLGATLLKDATSGNDPFAI